MAYIEKRRSKNGQLSYRVQIRRRGARPITQSFSRITDAKTWANQIESDLERGIVFGHDAGRHTLKETIERYEAEILPRKAKKSIARQKSELRYWKENIGHHLLKNVTEPVIVEARNALPVGSTTKNHYLVTLSHVFSVSQKQWGWASRNPCSNVDRLQTSIGRTRFLSEAELTRLLDACKLSENRALYPVVMVAIASGGRKSEVLGLRWNDVDLGSGRLIFRDTKNRDTRSVYVKGAALEALKDWARVRPLQTDLVFPSKSPRNGSHVPAEIKKEWEKARTKAELTDFVFHDLRHCFATYMLQSGATLGELAGALGHRQLQMVQRYAHLSSGHLEAIVERMNRKVLGG